MSFINCSHTHTRCQKKKDSFHSQSRRAGPLYSLWLSLWLHFHTHVSSEPSNNPVRAVHELLSSFQTSEKPKYLGDFFDGKLDLTAGKVVYSLDLTHLVCLITRWSPVSVICGKCTTLPFWNSKQAVSSKTHVAPRISDKRVWTCAPLLYR